jgi:hypothetical protein
MIAFLFGTEAQTPDSSKGDSILKKMSQKLASAKAFSVSSTEMHERVKSDGTKLPRNTTRNSVVQRPNAFWTKVSGDTDWQVWYDGKFFTAVSDKNKAFVQRSMPPTIDETLDDLAEKLNIDIPVSDIVYSSPYDAYMTGNPKGGLVGQEQIEGSQCNHLSYATDAANWELWINITDDLPCKLKITYTDDPAAPVHVVTFRNWNLAPQIAPDKFTFQIPEGYERIPILERVRLTENPQTQTKPSKNQ